MFLKGIFKEKKGFVFRKQLPPKKYKYENSNDFLLFVQNID